MTLRHFNPHDMDDAMLLQVATGRDNVLEDILQTVRANLSSGQKQHLLAVAPRGYGKSFLARLVALHLAKLRSGERLPVGVALLPEEQPNITAPHLLIEEIRRVFQHQSADSVIPTWFDEDEDEAAWNESLRKLDTTLDEAFGAGQGLLVALVENIDALLAAVFRENAAQSRLRKLLSEHPRLMLIATSASAMVDKDYQGRLFHAFRQVDLEPWSEQECIAYFNRQLAALGKPILDGSGEAKARTLALFIGGTPRLAALLAEILASKDARKAAEVLDALMDRLTPYYKHRIETLPWRSRKLLDALLRLGEPCSQSELAQRVGAQQSAIAQPFRDLQAERLVVGQRASSSRETLYRVADRVLAHYYRKRFLFHGLALSPLEAIAEFLQTFFTLEEKQAEAQRLRNLGLDADAAVLERLAQTELDGAGSWRSCVFNVAYRLRRYTALLAPAALPGLEAALTAFASHRPRETLVAFRRLDLANLPTIERLLWLLLAGSAAAQCSDEREQAFRWLDEAVDGAQAGDIATECFAALEIRSIWSSAAGRRADALADARKATGLQERLPAGEWRRYALCNAAWLETQDNHYAKAVSLASQLREQARKADDVFTGCRALRLLAWNLGQLGRHDEAVAAAQEAIVLAERCGEERERAASTRHLAWSLGQLGRHEEALIVAEAALSLAEKLQNAHEIAWVRLEVFRQSHALGLHERAVAAYLALLAVPKNQTDSKNRPEAKYEMAEAALDAIRSSRWADLQQAVLTHAEQFSSFPDQAEEEITEALLALAEQSGKIEAFAASASFIDAIAPVIVEGIAFKVLLSHRKSPMPYLTSREIDAPSSEELMCNETSGVWEQSITISPELANAFAELFRNVMSGLALRLDDPALLRDIAERIRERMPEENKTLLQLMEASARYVESGGDPRSLERVDPDIALAIQRTRRISATHGRKPL